jgi:hypothetical protein
MSLSYNYLQLRYEPFPASRSLWMDAAIYQSMLEAYPPLRPVPGHPEGRQPVLPGAEGFKQRATRKSAPQAARSAVGPQ